MPRDSATLIGDEGGFAPPCDSRSGIELVMQAIEKAGYSDICTVGLDVAASEFKVRVPSPRRPPPCEPPAAASSSTQ